MIDFELILPAYNESKNLAMLVERAAAAAKNAKHTPETFQLVVINNGSKDDSSVVLTQLKQSALGQWFRIVDIAVNQGYGFGVYTGLKATQAPYIGWSHADMQCDPADAFKALALLKKEGGSNILVRGQRSGRNWKDRLVTRVYQICSYLILGMNTTEINAQPKIFPRLLLNEIKNPPYTFAFDLYVLFQALKQGYRILSVPVLFPPRIHGVSNWAANFFSRYKTIFGIIRYMWNLRISEGQI